MADRTARADQGGDGLDRIAVTGIRARGFHGVLEKERRDGQTFVVDVELGVRTGPAAASDDLSDTVDYAAVAADVVAHVEGGPYDLIETLAERIATAALLREGVQRVTVTVHKPDAPVGVPFDDVTVTIVRHR
ncbi:MAG TPA: dihydroneopterin aldolase [Candidatus Nanopelagicales bacterium]